MTTKFCDTISGQNKKKKMFLTLKNIGTVKHKFMLPYSRGLEYDNCIWWQWKDDYTLLEA